MESMKKYIVIAAALLLSACASRPAQPPLALTLTPVLAQQATSQLAVQLSSKDERNHNFQWTILYFNSAVLSVKNRLNKSSFLY